MPTLVVYKDEEGRLSGWGEKGRRAYLKFRKIISELQPGETMDMSYRLPRSPQHHRYFFAQLGKLHDMQERFETQEGLIDWLKVGAGHCEFVPGRDGQLVALPKSIAWHNLDEQEFIEFHRAMRDFLWTPYAQECLWPSLTPTQRYAMLDHWERGVR